MPEPVITDYVKARDATITINGIAQRAKSASYRISCGEVDMCNLRSGKNWEGTTDIDTHDLQMTIAVSAAEGVPLPDPGSTTPCSYVTAGGKSHTGTLLILSSSESANPRGGYDYSISGKMTGPTTDV